MHHLPSLQLPRYLRLDLLPGRSAHNTPHHRANMLPLPLPRPFLRLPQHPLAPFPSTANIVPGPFSVAHSFQSPTVSALRAGSKK